MDGLYFDAASSKDYQDAALLALIADGVAFVRLLRVKTSDEQGISIFPDQVSFGTCPLHAIAMARTILNLLLETKREPIDIPLAETLAACDEDNIKTVPETSSKPRTKKRKTNEDNMKIHAYVNRIVKSASEAQTRAKPTPNMTSHSFRRSGAQHANGVATLSGQWIFDVVHGT
ncbi:hypothetical protein PHMEG_00026232 [Phytophthora megakarya]|uniref:Uncharacterized protein n=1 Tax=Phytophthora megakarya TaxID=4795 RepID=A0A225VCN2_9STRA|nr:hypothetical protein PHMEG_00026232 [Phytophthora megakarya]